MTTTSEKLAAALHRVLPFLGALHASNVNEITADARAALSAYDATVDTPQQAPHVVVHMEGGAVASVTADCSMSIMVIDYDTDGVDKDALTRVDQGDGTACDAVVHLLAPAEIDPAYTIGRFNTLAASEGTAC